MELSNSILRNTTLTEGTKLNTPERLTAAVMGLHGPFRNAQYVRSKLEALSPLHHSGWHSLQILAVQKCIIGVTSTM